CRPKQRRKLSHPVVWRSTDNSTALWDPSTRTASVDNILDPGTRSPPVENASQLTEKECCGNFLIQENQTSPQLLWTMSPGLQAELTQVSLFNDTSSSGSIQMTIAGDRSSFVMQIEPGTTGTYTDRNIGSIHVALTGSKPGVAEGKYIVTAFFRLGERKSG
ncbi:S-Ena type endospore appendage, partial [Cohnella sp.]|uniref:S-Ena type endospore appendage n=1 Tax=Cohnella sp. TaxID=1883426 RepID=UPI0037041716